MKKTLKILAAGCLWFSSCERPSRTDPLEVSADEKLEYSHWDQRYHDDPKDAFLVDVTPEVIDHINRNRWTQGQYQMPIAMTFGRTYDLNGDGVDELFVVTGEQDAKNHTYYLVLRMDRGRPEIIGALRSSFAFNKRPGEWDEIVERPFGTTYSWRKTGFRFDGEKYRRVWCVEKADEHSEPRRVEIEKE